MIKIRYIRVKYVLSKGLYYLILLMKIENYKYYIFLILKFFFLKVFSYN